jgi:peptidoglycan/xylan/chitin deacetylase (PgdA/CDA1 family)
VKNHTITFKTKKTKSKRMFLWTSIALLFLMGLGAIVFQEKIKAAFQREAPVAQTPAPETPALTPEEIALNATLSDPSMFGEITVENENDPEFVLNQSNVVSFLLYHDFSEKSSTNPMVINIAKFREQMKAIKDAAIPVISFQDFLDWRAGKKNIPDRAIVITIDDGWVGVHQLALPILKEFGYPFTLYLYTKYVNIGGRSLTTAQIRDIVQNGGEIGSHSNSHSSLTSRQGKGDAVYRKFLEDEIGESKKKLEAALNLSIQSFSYPYGNFNDDIAVMTTGEFGYTTGVTVNGAKNTWETPLNKLNRFTILGNDDSSFRIATSFRGQGSIMDANTLAGADNNQKGPKTKPEAGAVITNRSPLIEIDLSGIADIVPESIRLKIGGLGEIIPSYNPTSGLVSYQPSVRFRNGSVPVILTLNRKNQTKSEIVPWEFSINHSAYYLEQGIPKAVAEPPPESSEQTVPPEIPATLDNPAPRATVVPES